MVYDYLAFTGRGPSQVTENESGIIQLEASQLGRWISHVLPMPPAVTATRLMAQRQLQQQQCQQQQQQQLQQQSARIKEWPSFATENGHVINKKHSWKCFITLINTTACNRLSLQNCLSYVVSFWMKHSTDICCYREVCMSLRCFAIETFVPWVCKVFFELLKKLNYDSERMSVL